MAERLTRQLDQIKHLQYSKSRVTVKCNTCKSEFTGIGSEGVDFVEAHMNHKTWVLYLKDETIKNPKGEPSEPK